MDVLDRKAQALPQQLENYAIKQFKDGNTPVTQPRKGSRKQSVDRGQDIAGMRKDLARLTMGKGNVVGGPKEAKQGEVLERSRSLGQKPIVKRLEREYVGGGTLGRRQSPGQKTYDEDSQRTVITVDEGRRRRSSANTPTSRLSIDSIEQRREPRYHSPRTSTDLGRRDLYVVQVTEAAPVPAPKARSGSRELARVREVTVIQKEIRYTSVH